MGEVVNREMKMEPSRLPPFLFHTVIKRLNGVLYLEQESAQQNGSQIRLLEYQVEKVDSLPQVGTPMEIIGMKNLAMEVLLGIMHLMVDP
jgi:hypothetical protein